MIMRGASARRRNKAAKCCCPCGCRQPVNGKKKRGNEIECGHRASGLARPHVLLAQQLLALRRRRLSLSLSWRRRPPDLLMARKLSWLLPKNSHPMLLRMRAADLAQKCAWCGESANKLLHRAIMCSLQKTKLSDSFVGMITIIYCTLFYYKKVAGK